MEQAHTNPAVHAVMDKYTPMQAKALVHSHDEKLFVPHQTPQDIMAFYAEYDSYIHHWLLDDTYAFEFYANLQGGYNMAQARCKNEEERFSLQTLFLKDVVYLFIATVVYDLVASHGLLDKSFKEVEDYQLARDLEMQKEKLHIIDGGKS